MVKMNISFFSGLLIAVIATVGLLKTEDVAAQEALTVKYMLADSEVGHLEYYNMILELALEKTADTHGDFEMVPSGETFPQDEALAEVREGQELDVFPTMTSSRRERVFIPVRVPLVRGLIGTRLLMINSEDANSLAEKDSIEDLEEVILGQGSDWPDTRILERAGLQVEGTDSHEELFELLNNQSIDAFPRAVFEIWDELEDYSDKNFAVADGYYLYYPTAMYFFTQRSESGRELADRLETGLNKAMEDGSFEELFQQQMGEFLDLADLDNRNIIRMENPFLPEDTPTGVADYWLIED